MPRRLTKRIRANLKYILTATGTAAFIAFLIYVYFFTSEIELGNQRRSDKIIELSHIQIRGWDNSKIAWEVKARKADSTRNQEIANFEDISDGTIYKDGKVVASGLRAGKITVTAYNDKVEVFEKDKKNPVRAYVDMSAAMSAEADGGKKNAPALFRASHFIHDSRLKTTYADNVLIIDNKYTAKSSSMEVDHQRNLVTMTNHPVISAGKYIINAKIIESYFKENIVRAVDNVFLRINKKGLPSTVKSDTLFFSTKDYNAQMDGHVVFSQKGKKAFSDSMSYNDKTQDAVLMGNVVAVLSKAEAALNKSTLEKIKNAETKNLLKESTVLTCSRLIISTKSGKAQAEGQVELKQKGRTAKADYASYDEKNEFITMYGNVFIQRGDEWIKTEKIIVSIKDQTFEAIGAVESLFKIKKQRQ